MPGLITCCCFCFFVCYDSHCVRSMVRSVTRQFLVSLTNIVYIFPTMEVNETRNGLVTDILLNIRKSAELIQKR